MGSLRSRPETGLLYLDFRYEGKRYRETTQLLDTPTNRARLEKTLKRIEAEIESGTFRHENYFSAPGTPEKVVVSPSGRSPQAKPAEKPVTAPVAGVPSFCDFSEIWFSESAVRWRRATQDLNRTLLDVHVLPYFGAKALDEIVRADVLAFRSAIAAAPKGKDRGRSASTVNHIMGILRMVLAEASLRYDITDPTVNIRRMKLQRKDIQPFSLAEVRRIIEAARADFKNYFVVRFFTAMRSAEVHGLKWQNVDFERKQILVRETFNKGRVEYTKNDGSQREIDMSQTVFNALKDQKSATGEISEYVFCTRDGTPLDAKNVADRVWYPLLRLLGLRKRRPYECRHTCATLWLAAGENPEWIARQMGHSTTEMLFRVYSRYVPNLTRMDGSAFDRVLSDAMGYPAERS